MKSLLRVLPVASALACAVIVPQAFAQTVASGPYYATPSWDQTMPAASRFVVLSNFANAAVLDRETGIVWWRTAGAVNPYAQASFLCSVSGVGGRSGWRLPSLAELASIADENSYLPAGSPFIGYLGTRDYNAFWSSTIDAVSAYGSPAYAGIVSTWDFSQGHFSQALAQGSRTAPGPGAFPTTAYFTCVRGATQPAG